METLKMKKFVLMFASCSALMFAAPINPFNTRPVFIGSTSDPATACQPFAADCELQTLLNKLNPGDGLNATTDQQSAGMWKLGGSNPTAIPIMSIEVTANDSTQQMGIWSDTDMDDSTSGDRTLVDIFLGPATGNTNGGATTAALSFNTITGALTITQITGPAGSVNGGTFFGVSSSAFGFYLQPNGTSVPTYYTVDQLNPTGAAQSVAYRVVSANRWTIGFEDQLVPGGDRDYNDFMFQIESIEPVPEPGFYGVVALGLSGLFYAYRRRKTAKV